MWSALPVLPCLCCPAYLRAVGACTATRLAPVCVVQVHFATNVWDYMWCGYWPTMVIISLGRHCHPGVDSAAGVRA
ncbi:unnamed protein product [Parajaminaea phylloscopi]